MVQAPTQITLGGPEENQKSINYSLCLTCSKMLNRPSEDWNNRTGNKHGYGNRHISDIRSSADDGCIFCKIVHSVFSSNTIDKPWSENLNRGVSCFLHWNQEACKFEDIYISIAQERIFLLPEEEVEFLVYSKKDQMLNASSQACWRLIDHWLLTCLNDHESCNHKVEENGWLPTRLIDIGSSKSAFAPRVILSGETDIELKNANYITLSHRWDSTMLTKLTSTNLTQYRQKIPMDNLPCTFKDALHLARRLEIRFIWIDSLCILQDSAEDWLQESSLMGKIYECSYCNIAAAAAAEGSGRLYADRDTDLISPFKIDIIWKGHQRSYYCLIRGFWHIGVTKALLNRRGWVLQERLLSPRTLSFNSQLFWECRELKACEAAPNGFRKCMDLSPDDVDDDSELCPKSWSIEIASLENKYQLWTRVVEQFTVSGLTNHEDKLIALSGVARRMQPLLDDNYVAGLWENNLLFDLLWYIEKGRQANWEPSFRINSYRAPSWSWASVEGRVQFPRHGGLDIEWGPSLIEISAINLELASGDSTGPVTSGFIVVSGELNRMPEFSHLPEHVYSMVPGTGMACCVDDEYDLQYSLNNVFLLPVRIMRSVNGRMLLCLILSPSPKTTEEFCRVGLLSLEQGELEGFEWAEKFFQVEKFIRKKQMIRMV